MENVLGQVNVATKLKAGIIEGFIQDDINAEVADLLLENVHAKIIIDKLECDFYSLSSDQLSNETKGLLSKVVKNNLSRIEALQLQIGDKT